MLTAGDVQAGKVGPMDLQGVGREFGRMYVQLCKNLASDTIHRESECDESRTNFISVVQTTLPGSLGRMQARIHTCEVPVDGCYIACILQPPFVRLHDAYLYDFLLHRRSAISINQVLSEVRFWNGFM